ncbi:hypothetical protein F5B22DRAFT_639157 [Xylaria bambusicola]|uniref:uncharacterized protein n=1 Tax=Xylaria bambusicola TaxID=326684 RepID=UPI00200873A1|nr:uncharacterized protein F5B22DRAFT_639157 [Xylaria bambusicola]KAI0506520.1 hypothetical protein F5B22DRAFT_639157 [Xylaria bambusicola]
MKRRSAKKSRHGCSECKRRHVKCDETKPSCANCNVRQLSCSFLPALPVPCGAAPAGTSPHSSCPASGASGSAQSGQAPRRAAVLAPWSIYDPAFTISSLAATEQTFKLHHLELLHNFKVGVLGDSVYTSSAADGYMSMTVRAAARAPYLMDQALAVSAAHMSVKRPHQRCFYLKEAAHLQTRALTLFNAAQVLNTTDHDHVLARFVFSTLLSHQVLFDAFSTRIDFPTLLDRLVAALRICGGVRLMCGEWWPFIMTQYQEQVGIDLLHQSLNVAGPETALKKPNNRRFRATRLHQWAVRVPSSFINLVEKRQPEALIIVAYYALLIHDAKGYWVSGGAGAFIIRSITAFLGEYWAQWLTWPNEVLDSVET